MKAQRHSLPLRTPQRWSATDRQCIARHTSDSHHRKRDTSPHLALPYEFRGSTPCIQVETEYALNIILLAVHDPPCWPIVSTINIPSIRMLVNRSLLDPRERRWKRVISCGNVGGL